jgi:chromosome partitioning protein
MLSEVEKDYDLILFDLPPDFNRVTIAAHCYCDTCLIPVNMNSFSLKGIKLTYDHLEYLEDEFGVKLNKQIILNKIDSRNTSAYEIISDLSARYPEDVCKKIIPISKPLEDAFLRKKCVWKTVRAKPALDSIDGIVWSLMEIDGWNSALSKKSGGIRRSENAKGL